METAAKTAIFILVVLSLGLWIVQVHPHLAAASMSAVSIVPLEPGVIASQQHVLPQFQEAGVLMYDLSHGTPGTPYLVYLDTNTRVATKQLIFSDSGCDSSAADMPCSTPPYNTPDISAGTPLAVTGGVEDQGVFVDSYQEVSVPDNMLIFRAYLNQPVVLSNGASITLLSIATNASCTLGAGCFGDGTARAVMRITSGGLTTDAELVPGALHESYKTTFIILSIDGTDAGTQVKVLAIRHK